MKKLFLLLSIICLAASCKNAPKKEVGLGLAFPESAPSNNVENVIENARPSSTKPNGNIFNDNKSSSNKVYCYSYDGFLNLRAEPSSKAAKVGKFYNGPEGATLIENLGAWTKVEVNGIEGYVYSKYVVDTPTVSYIGCVDVDWIVGVWADSGGFGYNIYANGYWDSGYNYPARRGYYIMQNNEVKLVEVSSLKDADPLQDQWEWSGAKGLPSDEGTTYVIDQRAGRLGNMRRVSFLKGNENAEELEGIDWFYTTKADFKNAGRAIAKKVEPYLKR